MRSVCSLASLPSRLHILPLTYAVQAIQCNSLKGPSHHGIFLQHLIKVVHAQGVEAAVSIRPHTGCAPASGQQADLCGDSRTQGYLDTEYPCHPELHHPDLGPHCSVQ